MPFEEQYYTSPIYLKGFTKIHKHTRLPTETTITQRNIFALVALSPHRRLINDPDTF